MPKRDHNIFANAASLLLCGVLAGVVVAAAAFPAFAMGGLALKGAADGFAELDSTLDLPAPPQITFVYADDARTLITSFYDENRRDIPLEDIPQVMQDAIVAAEDQRFYEHKGVDVQGVVRAFVANQNSANVQGASTLTMQYVRLSRTYSATSPMDVVEATEDTNARKLREIRTAIGLEQRLTKQQILQNYLNIAAFGRGSYGVQAAATVYFNKDPRDLTLAEAAFLAGLPKAPSDYEPTDANLDNAGLTGMDRALGRRHYVLEQMAKLGMITAEQAAAADAEPIEATGQRTPNGCTATAENHWGFFCDYFYRWWLSQEGIGETEAVREHKLKSGGYRITTSLNAPIQNAAHVYVEDQLATGNRDALLLAAIEPGTGYVTAMKANRTYGLNTEGNPISSDPAKAAAGTQGTYPVTTNPLISGGEDLSGYKSGSTYKMFTMLTALEKGYPLDFTINARSPYPSRLYPAAAEDRGRCGTKWCPVNANPSWMNGPRTMWSGFGRSVNTYFVPLEELVGAENVIEMARRLGVTFRNPLDIANTTNPDSAHLLGGFTLGVTDGVPLELANAYATVAADGVYCKPLPVRTVVDLEGAIHSELTTPQCNQAISPEVARAAADAARCPIMDNGGLGRCDGGTASSYYERGTAAATVGYPVIGKTGTADDNWTANFVISTKQMAVATQLANPDFAEQSHNGTDIARLPNIAAVNTLRDAMTGKERIDFAAPPNNLIYGTKVAIPDVKCKSVQEATAAIQGAGFSVFTDTTKVESECPADTVAKTDPTGSVSKGSIIGLIISKGPAATTPPATGGGTGGGTGGSGGGTGGGDGGSDG